MPKVFDSDSLWFRVSPYYGLRRPLVALRNRSENNFLFPGENWRNRESSECRLVLRRLNVKTEPKDMDWGSTSGKMTLRARKKSLDKSNGNWEVSRKSNLRKRSKAVDYKMRKGSSSSTTKSNDLDDSGDSKDSNDSNNSNDSDDSGDSESDDSQSSVSHTSVSEERSDRTPTFELISD